MEPSTIIDAAIGCATAIAGGVTIGIKVVGARFARMEREAKEDHRRERESCEARFSGLSAEIKQVRDHQTGDMAKVLTANALAMADVAHASREGTAVLDRVCRHLVALPCAKDGAERLKELTPLGNHRTPRPETKA